MVPGERIELPTNGLQNRCSTAELTRHRHKGHSDSEDKTVPYRGYRIATPSAAFCVGPRTPVVDIIPYLRSSFGFHSCASFFASAIFSGLIC
jgi:hypothetical protein